MKPVNLSALAPALREFDFCLAKNQGVSAEIRNQSKLTATRNACGRYTGNVVYRLIWQLSGYPIGSRSSNRRVVLTTIFEHQGDADWVIGRQRWFKIHTTYCEGSAISLEGKPQSSGS